MPYHRKVVTQQKERIPRRPPPDFKESEAGMMEAISEDGFLDVALNDVNQYGPHAMVMLLGVFASLTGLVLLALMAL
ncbi:MAG TPA: hypothetical protein EYQ15_00125 [Candidatus Poseidoniales archaeon]|jgi:hypothetical protein|nr:MAG: hypothetical protein CXT65_02685 [Euryarchaeota archaeon]HIG37712.1 hypothetical protein [Candidatus Poseidoniales archaeon]HIL43443.1 hypothetical protein [Candidatus Poseidoniales archaeon]